MNAFVSWTATNVLVVAVLFPAVWLASWCLRRRPAVAHLLWFFLLLRLILPPVIHWPWSAADLLRLFDQWPPASAIRIVPTYTDRAAAVRSARTAATEMVIVSAADTPGNRFEHRDTKQFSSEIRNGKRHDSGATAASGGMIRPTLFAAWLTGTAVCGMSLWRKISNQRRILCDITPPPAELVASVNKLAVQLGLRPPPIALSRHVSTPAVCCLGRPCLVWPSTMAECSQAAEYEGIVAHELAHLVRCDHWLLRIELLVTLCWWWNPLLWLIRRQLHETRELACDALALAITGHARNVYARRLLNLSIASYGPHNLAPAFGAGSVSRRFLKRRLTMLFDDRVQGRLSAAGLLLALLLAAFGLPGLTLADAELDSASDEAATTVTERTEAKDTLAETTIEVATNGSPSESNDAFVTEVVEDIVSDDAGREQVRQIQTSKVLFKSVDDQHTQEIPFPAGGGKVRITITDDGKLLVIVEQSVASPESTVSESTDSTAFPTRRRSIELRKRTAGSSAASSTARSQVPPKVSVFTKLPDSPTAPSSGSAAPTGNHYDRDILHLELELANLNIQEKRAELEIAMKEGVDESRLRLAELAIRRAEIELQKTSLRLKGHIEPK